ncbi:MAG: hypothetical protein ABIR80_05310, partial [Opitutaceae bacterium]
MNRENQHPITLEDIIRLKRAERPPAQFWERFDRELRAKQLSALLEKRPWWREISFSWAVPRFGRYTLPLGAAAILAVGFMAMRHSPTGVATGSATPQARAFVSAQPAMAEAVEVVAMEENRA